MSAYLGEMCKCGVRIAHPEEYIYECSGCGLKYRVNPASKSKPIEILNKSNFEGKK